MSPSRRMGAALLAAAAVLVAPAAAAAHRYTPVFQDPGALPAPDLSLENHAIGLVDATPAGERITFAFRDFNRQPVADALIRAHGRGVAVDGVIDGGERTRPVVRGLQAALGPDRVVLCGSPTFEFHSCIANSMPESLQHNKFMTFSRTSDGREDVVLQTSMNFFERSQLTYYNDMLEIDGDAKLHAAYVDYLLAMKAQVRSGDHYFVRSGDDGRNTMFPSPRPQADRETDDTIVDRMDEIDCSRGGRIRIANMAFRTERAVIMRKLVRLHRQGCDIEVVATNLDGDILAGLVAAGIPVHPFFIAAADGRQQVIVHSKFWLVDARSKVTGRRQKIAYVGSSNWRADQQYSDDLLLRVVDDGVHDAYVRYWELIRSRAASRGTARAATDTVLPRSALAVTPDRGWSRSDVTLRVAASDGHNVQGSGLARLRVELSGAQTGSFDFPGETDGYNVQELPVSAEGETTVSHFAEDAKGNAEPERTDVVRIDRTRPSIAGMPRRCRLWPPDGRLVRVADVSADDALSGVARLSVTASRGAVVRGGTVYLRAARGAYTIRARAKDVAGNRRSASARCIVG